MQGITTIQDGKISLSEKLIHHLGVAQGAEIEIEQLPHGELRVRAVANVHTLDGLAGLLKREDQCPKTIVEIENAITSAWSDRQ